MWANTLKKVSEPQHTRMSLGGERVKKYVLAKQTINLLNLLKIKKTNSDRCKDIAFLNVFDFPSDY